MLSNTLLSKYSVDFLFKYIANSHQLSLKMEYKMQTDRFTWSHSKSGFKLNRNNTTKIKSYFAQPI